MNPNPPAAPSAATPAAAIPAAPAPAPRAAAPETPKTLADYQELALKSMTSEAAPEPAPAVPGQEPSPATEPPPASPELPLPGLEPAPAAEPQSTAEDDEPEVPTTEQATWTEGEKNIYGALVKERNKRKEARKEVVELKEKQTQLEAKLNEMGKVAAPPANTPQPEPAGPTPRGAGLEHCISFAQVDAEVSSAAKTEILAFDLQNTLTRDGRTAVLPQLEAQGVKEINGVPLAEASDRQIGDFLSQAFKGAKLTQANAEPRKRFLVAEDAAVTLALKEMPELANPKSTRAQRFKAILAANPSFKLQGPNWPVVVMTYIQGEEARQAKSAPQPPAPAAKPAPAPKVEIVPPVATRKLPGAPAASGAALPQTTEFKAAQDRIKAGTATMADVQLMAKASLVGA